MSLVAIGDKKKSNFFSLRRTWELGTRNQGKKNQLWMSGEEKRQSCQNELWTFPDKVNNMYFARISKIHKVTFLIPIFHDGGYYFHILTPVNP